MKAIAVSNELHQFLARVKIKGGSKLTPAIFLDYLVFGMDNASRTEVVMAIIEKAKKDGILPIEIAQKVEDSMVG
tara:strand:+ start:242 stop:466 length:225 start_codon:yes stop_codon:yes gene_type:complete